MEVNKYLKMLEEFSAKKKGGRRAGKQPVVSVIITIIILSLDWHNGNVRIYQRANVAVIPRGSRYIWHLGKPLTRFMDI